MPGPPCGAGHFGGRENAAGKLLGMMGSGCGFSMAGRDVKLTIAAVLTAERRCLNYALCDFAF
ncbi:hypothetical protein [Paradesulfitobacterium aromaticivorans]